MDDLIELDQNNWLDRFVELFFISIIVLVAYIVLSLKCVDDYFRAQIPSYYHRVASKGLLLFVIALLATAAILPLTEPKKDD